MVVRAPSVVCGCRCCRWWRNVLRGHRVPVPAQEYKLQLDAFFRPSSPPPIDERPCSSLVNPVPPSEAYDG